MKIAVIGGSSGTGYELAEQALRAGHDVTVISRSGTAPSGVHAVRGDASDPDVVAQAVEECAAVFVTVGGSKGSRGHRSRVTRAVINGMNKAGVNRLIIHSSVGAGDSGKHLPRVLRWFATISLAVPLADHNEQEAAVRESDLQWTIVRPSGLKDKEATGHVTALDSTDDGTISGTISRADLAEFMLGLITDSESIRTAISVSEAK